MSLLLLFGGSTPTHPVADGITRLVAGAIHGRAYGSFAGKSAGGGSAVPVFLSHYRQWGDADVIYLRQSTAGQELILGPFLDDTDGKTAETGLTVANTDIKVWKRGGTVEANKNSGGATHIASGRYYAVMDATDTDTIGELEVNVHVTGALPVKVRCCVLDEAVFDVLFGTTAPSTYAGADTSGTTTLLSRIGSALTITSGRVNADVTHIATAAVNTSAAQLGVNVVNFGGSAGTFASGRPEVNASHFGGAPVTATTSVTFPAASTVATTTGAVGSVTGAVGSVTGAVGSVTGNVGGNVTGSVGSIATGGIAAASFAAGAITAAAVATGAIDADALAADAGTEIGTAVWATATRTLTAATNVTSTGAAVPITAGGLVSADVTAISTDTVAADNAEAFFDGTGYAGTNNVIPTVSSVTAVATGGITAGSIAADAIGASELAADAVAEIADAVWDEVLSGHLTAGTTGAALNAANAPTAAAVADAVWDEALSGHLSAGSTGEALNAAGSAGDPWTTTLPGAYTGSQAGKMLSDILTDTAEIGTAGAGLTALAPAATALSTATWTGTRAGYLDNLSGGAVALASGVTLTNGAITAAKFDSTTAFPLVQADTGSTALARTGADGDTLETLSDQLDSAATTAANVDGNVSSLITTRDSMVQTDIGTGQQSFVTLAVEEVWTVGTRTLTSGANIALAKGVGVTGFTDLSAADVRSAVGLASANLDTQLGTLSTGADLATVDTVVDAIKVKTDQLTFTVANQVDANTESINATPVIGVGTSGNKWRA